LTPVNIHIGSAHRRVDRKIAPRQIRPAREHLLSAHSKLIQARVLQCDAVEFSSVEMVDEHRDIASASLIESWIDETEQRNWFLFESSRRGDKTGH
jgi:DNA-binding ferritin-like protein